MLFSTSFTSCFRGCIKLVHIPNKTTEQRKTHFVGVHSLSGGDDFLPHFVWASCVQISFLQNSIKFMSAKWRRIAFVLAFFFNTVSNYVVYNNKVLFGCTSGKNAVLQPFFVFPFCPFLLNFVAISPLLLCLLLSLDVPNAQRERKHIILDTWIQEPVISPLCLWLIFSISTTENKTLHWLTPFFVSWIIQGFGAF